MLNKNEDGTYRYYRPDNKPFTLYHKKQYDTTATPVVVGNLLHLTYENRQQWFKVVKIDKTELTLELMTKSEVPDK